MTVDRASAQSQLREATSSSATSVNGKSLELTTGCFHVPELSAEEGTGPNAIELAIVRVRRPGMVVQRSAHIILAGGPGDSGVNLVMGLVRQGGPTVWQLFDGDVIGIDLGERAVDVRTSRRQALNLPLESPASMEEWLPRSGS